MLVEQIPKSLIQQENSQTMQQLGPQPIQQLDSRSLVQLEQQVDPPEINVKLEQKQTQQILYQAPQQLSFLEKRRLQRRKVKSKFWAFDSDDEELQREQVYISQLREVEKKDVEKWHQNQNLLQEQQKLTAEQEKQKKKQEKLQKKQIRKIKKEQKKQELLMKKEKKKKKKKDSNDSSDTSIDESEDEQNKEEIKIEEETNKNNNFMDSDIVGPQPLKIQSVSNQKPGTNAGYGGQLLPGEGSAIAQYIQQGKRIPQRGEIGLTSDQISAYEKAGFVMSGQRHKRMTAIRLRKEAQVYSIEEKKALKLYKQEQRFKKEKVLIDQYKTILSDKLNSKKQ